MGVQGGQSGARRGEAVRQPQKNKGIGREKEGEGGQNTRAEGVRKEGSGVGC